MTAALHQLLDDTHLVVLAGGAGLRLRALTRRLDEGPRPKQFCRFGGARSLLQRTVERTLAWIPATRVHVVVTGSQDTLAARQLRRYPGAHLIVQPLNRGTGPAALLGVLSVEMHHPSALVLLAPCDHVFADREELYSALARACRAARALDAVVVVGAEADAPCADYGWILTETRAAPIPRVLALIEKPSPSRAQRLLDAGALWSTLIAVAPAVAFARMFDETFPELVDSFRQALALPPAQRHVALRRAYAAHAPVDLSRDVLAHTSNLRACPLSRRAEWLDLGDERRLLAWLTRQGVFAPSFEQRGRAPST